MFKAIVTITGEDRTEILSAISQLEAKARSWPMREDINLISGRVALQQEIQAGQRWECANGKVVDIDLSSNSVNYPFVGIDISSGMMTDTYTNHGTVWKDSNCDRDLVKKVDFKGPKADEYWVDVSGNVHLMYSNGNGNVHLMSDQKRIFMSYFKDGKLFFNLRGVCTDVEFADGHCPPCFQFNLCNQVEFKAV